MKTLGDRYKRSCFNKVQHPDKNTAQREAQRMERLEKAPFVVYHCECCGRWHTAHKEIRHESKGVRDLVRDNYDATGRGGHHRPHSR